MTIIAFSDKKSPFPAVPISKIPAELMKQMALDVRKNKQPKKDAK